MNAKNYIAKLQMQPHPEGGYFSEFYRTKEQIKPLHARYAEQLRAAGSSIYYLLEGTDFSAWHCLKSTEIWHFYAGSAITLYSINKATTELTVHLLGNPYQTANAEFQVVMEAECWFAAELIDKTSFCLAGCTVMPAFEYADFMLGNRQELQKAFPQHKQIIARLTRL